MDLQSVAIALKTDLMQHTDETKRSELITAALRRLEIRATSDDVAHINRMAKQTQTGWFFVAMFEHYLMNGRNGSVIDG